MHAPNSFVYFSFSEKSKYSKVPSQIKCLLLITMKCRTCWLGARVKTHQPKILASTLLQLTTNEISVVHIFVSFSNFELDVLTEACDHDHRPHATFA